MAECEPAFRDAKVGVGAGLTGRALGASALSIHSYADQQALPPQGEASRWFGFRCSGGCGKIQVPLSSPCACLNRSWQVVDAAVLRFPRAVTHFSPGSAQWRPTQVRWCGGWEAGEAGTPHAERARRDASGIRCRSTPCRPPSAPLQETSIPNLFLAGDWVKGLQHGANGLSQVSSTMWPCTRGAS